MISVPIPLTPSTVSHPATSIPPSNLPSRFAANRGSIQASEGENPSGLDRSGKASMGDKADPRMPSAARPYVAPLINPNDLPPDYSSLLAIIFGIAGVMLRQKVASWFSLVFIAQALANMKNMENDLKQIIMALTFAVMGLVTNYFGPAPRMAPKKT